MYVCLSFFSPSLPVFLIQPPIHPPTYSFTHPAGGFTPQYKGLQELQDKYGPKGFTVLAFPCNRTSDFRGRVGWSCTHIHTRSRT